MRLSKSYLSLMSASNNKIEARYTGGKFTVSYDLQDVDPENLQLYDQIQIKEILSYPGCEDVTNGVSATQSVLQKGSVEVESLVQLGIGDGRYYAVFLSGTSLKEICRSDVFTIDEDDDNYPSSDGRTTKSELESMCQIEVINICQIDRGTQGRKNCEITIEWKFNDDMPAKMKLSESDWICVIPSKLSDSDFSYLYSQHAFGMASGKKEGTVKLLLGGYVEVGEEYQAFYFSNTVGENKLGSSDTFTIQPGDLPEIKNKDREETLMESRKYNTVSVLQYTMQSQMKSMEAASNDYNPLLTIGEVFS